MELITTMCKDAWLPLVLSALLGYLLGSIDFAIVVTKIFVHEDIRTKGSGNAGATNVLRSHGKGLAALTTLGDVLKCVAAVLLSRFVLFPLLDADVFAVCGAHVAGVFCVAGHMFPLYFGFRGGKGVLTILGMMLVLNWDAALVALGAFIIVVLLSKMVSLGSIIAGTVLCIYNYIDLKYIEKIASTDVLIFCSACVIVVVALAIMKHSSNIKRILNGTENKLGAKKGA